MRSASLTCESQEKNTRPNGQEQPEPIDAETGLAGSRGWGWERWGWGWWGPGASPGCADDPSVSDLLLGPLTRNTLSRIRLNNDRTEDVRVRSPNQRMCRLASQRDFAGASESRASRRGAIPGCRGGAVRSRGLRAGGSRALGEGHVTAEERPSEEAGFERTLTRTEQAASASRRARGDGPRPTASAPRPRNVTFLRRAARGPSLSAPRSPHRHAFL